MLHTKLPIIPHRPIKVRKIPCSQNLHHSETWSGPSEAVDGHFVDMLVSWVSLAFSIFCVMFLLLSFGSWSSPMESRHQTKKSSDKAFIFWKVGILNDAYCLHRNSKICVTKVLSRLSIFWKAFYKLLCVTWNSTFQRQFISLCRDKLLISRCQGYIMYASWERSWHLSKLSDAKKWMKYVLLFAFGTLLQSNLPFSNRHRRQFNLILFFLCKKILPTRLFH